MSIPFKNPENLAENRFTFPYLAETEKFLMLKCRSTLQRRALFLFLSVIPYCITEDLTIPLNDGVSS